MEKDKLDQAWDQLQFPVRKVVEETNEAAVVVTLVRFAAHLHLVETAKREMTLEESQKFFMRIVQTCFARQVQDGSWP